MALSTVSRILNALHDEGLMVPGTVRGWFRLGSEIARRVRTVRPVLVMDLHPFLEELCCELQETVDLSMLDGDRANFIDQVIGPHRLQASSAVEESFSLYCCANGKAILASLPPVRRI